jgi:ribosomal protein L44E
MWAELRYGTVSSSVSTYKQKKFSEFSDEHRKRTKREKNTYSEISRLEKKGEASATQQHRKIPDLTVLSPFEQCKTNFW